VNTCTFLVEDITIRFSHCQGIDQTISYPKFAAYYGVCVEMSEEKMGLHFFLAHLHANSIALDKLWRHFVGSPCPSANLLARLP
jgi:hypothetical protein